MINNDQNTLGMGVSVHKESLNDVSNVAPPTISQLTPRKTRVGPIIITGIIICIGIALIASAMSKEEPRTILNVPNSYDYADLYPHYSKDSKHAYFHTPVYSIGNREMYERGNVIKGADVHSFQAITQEYASDKDYLYYGSKQLEGPGVKKIRTLSNQDYEKETWVATERKVYYWGKELPDVDGESFERIGTYYSKDKKNVFLGSGSDMVMIHGADVSTFEVISESVLLLAKDKNHVYEAGKVIDGANPITFSAAGVILKDGKHVYCKTSILRNADVASYGTVPTKNGSYSHKYAKDKQYVYSLLLCTRIENADPGTFTAETEYSNVATDSKRRYFMNGNILDTR